ncbi:SDR family oxidoreductase [Photobacterium sp. MCCC 1A19761]|uniref:SDR family oxidoreductase n=1 Tax=Photobacterium sp. MCCC 1A19761 TaxID=3115000 RepID=UPI00307E6679
MNLDQKRILLTGATGGIGSATAIKLAEAGAHLVLVGRKQDKLDALKAQLANPGQHLTITADLSQPDGLSTLDSTCRTWREQGIRIDVVINNAGTNQFAYLSQRLGASIEQEFQLNLITPVLLSQKALGWINRPGIILNVGSTFGAIGYPGFSTYCAAKAALHRFSEAMQRELQGAGIQMLYLAPRATATRLNDDRVTALNDALGNNTDQPETVAAAITTALRKESTCTWLGWPEKLFVRLNQLLPGLVSSSIRKQHSRITEFVSKTL